jgi:hypothetical protein
MALCSICLLPGSNFRFQGEWIHPIRLLPKRREPGTERRYLGTLADDKIERIEGRS